MNTISSKHTFTKAERLSGRKIIDELVKKGRSFNLFPFRLSWLETKAGSDFPAQVLMAVPKRNFKSSVDRNKIRRHMREAYRKNKSLIYQPLQEGKQQIALMFVYVAKTTIVSADAEKSMILSLLRLKKEISKHASK